MSLKFFIMPWKLCLLNAYHKETKNARRVKIFTSQINRLKTSIDVLSLFAKKETKQFALSLISFSILEASAACSKHQITTAIPHIKAYCRNRSNSYSCYLRCRRGYKLNGSSRVRCRNGSFFPSLDDISCTSKSFTFLSILFAISSINIKPFTSSVQAQNRPDMYV